MANRAKQFYMMPYKLCHSKLYKTLSHAAQALFGQILGSRYKKNSSGEIVNSDRHSIEFGFSDSFGFCKGTYSNALKELEVKGLIQLVTPGRFPNRKAVYSLSDKWKEYNMSPAIIGYFSTKDWLKRDKDLGDEYLIIDTETGEMKRDGDE